MLFPLPVKRMPQSLSIRIYTSQNAQLWLFGPKASSSSSQGSLALESIPPKLS